MRRSALRSGNAPFTGPYQVVSEVISELPGVTIRAGELADGISTGIRAGLDNNANIPQLIDMNRATRRSRVREAATGNMQRVPSWVDAGDEYYRLRMERPTARGGSGDIEDTAPTAGARFDPNDDEYDPFTVFEFGKRRPKARPGAAFGVLQPTRSISDSRNIRRDSEDALREMWNLRRNRVRELMRREIAGDIIFPDRPWHRAAPPYATTIQRYARGMIARNTN
jgi:hypothetical protein